MRVRCVLLAGAVGLALAICNAPLSTATQGEAAKKQKAHNWEYACTRASSCLSNMVEAQEKSRHEVAFDGSGLTPKMDWCSLPYLAMYSVFGRPIAVDRDEKFSKSFTYSADLNRTTTTKISGTVHKLHSISGTYTVSFDKKPESCAGSPDSVTNKFRTKYKSVAGAN